MAKSFPTDLIVRIDENEHSIANLQSFSRKQLEQFYSPEDATFIEQKVNRQPIESDVLDQVLAASGDACAYCADGSPARPYQIHHIVPYSETQDNTAENLMLVCPTCHVALHTRGDSLEVQKQARAKWYAIASVARSYGARGLSFPYGAFEALHYRGNVTAPSVLEAVIPPLLARELATHSLAQNLLNRLATSNFSLVTGKPGSGKSTLIIGVGGAMSQRQVFRYRPSNKQDNRDSLGELLTFVASAGVSSVLLVDDANVVLSDSDLETLATSATETVKVVASMTSENYDSRAELHLRDHCIQVHWEALKSKVVEYCVEHDFELASVLRRIRPEDDLDRVGLGATETSVRALVRRYAEVSTTAWHFRFLLRGGWGMVREDVRSLVSDQAHLPVLFAAIEQIAAVERFVTPEETAEALAGLGEGKLSVAWVRDLFEKLCSRRVMLKRRDGYSTLHREWARAFISACLDHDTAAADARTLLARDFDLATTTPKRLMILWSWFYRDRGGAGRFVNEWPRKQSRDHWPLLIATAAERSLVEIALVASRLRLLFPNPRWHESVGAGYRTAEEQIAAQVRSATSKDWYWLRELFMGLNYATKDTAKRIIETCDPAAFAQLIERATTADYEHVSWFLSGVTKHSPGWVASIGQHLRWVPVSEALEALDPGQVEDVFALYDVLQSLKVPVLRSHIRRMTDAIRDCLGSARLEQIHWWRPRHFLTMMFPKETRRFADKLDASKLASQLMTSSPSDWGRMGTMFFYLTSAGSSFPVDLVKQLDISSLANKLALEGRAHPYGARMLIWQLAHGKGERGEEMAAALFDSIRGICESSKDEAANILRAFAGLSVAYAQRLIAESGFSREALADDGNDDAGDVHEEIADYFRTLDNTGEDFDVQAAFADLLSSREDAGRSK